MVKGYRPGTLSEALEILSKDHCMIMAGGTDLMVQRARGSGVTPGFERPLMFTGHLGELKQIKKNDGFIHIGAGAILSDLMNDSLIPDIFKEIIGKMASPPTRNMASIGGNICNASPAADVLPYLYAVNAELRLHNIRRERTITIRDLIIAPKKTILENDELMTEIIIPDKKFDINVYRKIGQRKGMSLTKVSFLGLADISGNTIRDIRITLGSVAPLIVRSEEIEKTMINKDTEEVAGLANQITERYSHLIEPIDDARSTAIYRKRTSMNLIRDFLINIEENNRSTV